MGARRRSRFAHAADLRWGQQTPHLVSRRQAPRLRGRSTTSANNCTRSTRTVAASPSAYNQRPAADAVFMVVRQRDRLFGATGLGRRFYRNLGSSIGRRPQAEALPGISFQPDLPGVLTRRAWTHVSNESGGDRSVCTAHPGPGEKIRISTAGGIEPVWTATGRELLYRANTGSGQGFFSAAIRPRLRSGTTRLACCSRPDPVSTHPRRPSEAGRSAPTASGSFCCDPLNRRTSRSPWCTSC